jgi:hypothetical protein
VGGTKLGDGVIVPNFGMTNVLRGKLARVFESVERRTADLQ